MSLLVGFNSTVLTSSLGLHSPLLASAPVQPARIGHQEIACIHDPETLRSHYTAQFKATGAQDYFPQIIDATLAIKVTSLELPHHLLEAYVQADDCGSKNQLYTAMAVAYLWRVHHSVTPHESPQVPILKQLLETALDNEDPTVRIAFMHAIFQVMENGARLADLNYLAARFGTDPVEIASELTASSIAQLFRPPRLIPHAAPELTAETINGTVHTAFINNLPLARKIAAMIPEVAHYTRRDTTGYQTARTRLYQRALTFAHTGAALSAEIILQLFSLNSDAARAANTDQPKILIKSDTEFNALLERQGLANTPDTYSSFNAIYRQGLDAHPEGEIWIRELSQTQATARANEIVARVLEFPHEREHWRHFNDATPLSLDHMDAETWLISEMLACLEGNRWRMKNHDIDSWIIARRLGLNLPRYLKYSLMAAPQRGM